jgi:hypothetical protein
VATVKVKIKRSALRAQLAEAARLLTAAQRDHLRGRIVILSAKDGNSPLESILDERSTLVDVEMNIAVETIDVTTCFDSSQQSYISGRTRTFTLRLRD